MLAVCAAQMGAAHGASGIPAHLREGLLDSKAISTEIDSYITALFPAEAQAEQKQAPVVAAGAGGASGEL
jgi:N-formylglutamate amidohydrolase